MSKVIHPKVYFTIAHTCTEDWSRIGSRTSVCSIWIQFRKLRAHALTMCSHQLTTPCQHHSKYSKLGKGVQIRKKKWCWLTNATQRSQLKCWLTADINLQRKTQTKTPQGKAMVQLMKKKSKRNLTSWNLKKSWKNIPWPYKIGPRGLKLLQTDKLASRQVYKINSK